MKRFILIPAVIGFTVLVSCSTSKIQPEADKSIVLFYVEEFHKPINKPRIELQVEGMEKTLKLYLKAPAAVVHLPPAGLLHADGWITPEDIVLSGLDSFDFDASAGSVTLAPVKIQVISKTQIEVKLLTQLDLEYAKGRFAQNKDFDGIEITYLEVAEEEEAETVSE